MLKAFIITRVARMLRRLEPRRQLSLSVRADLISPPASSSRPAPSSPPSVDGIPSADVPPPASAEPLSSAAPARAVRFVALKVWATRLGIVGLVAMGFGTFTLFITRSVVGLAIGAAVGVALSVRRALRISADDIDF